VRTLFFFFCVGSAFGSDLNLSNAGKVPVLVQWVNWGPAPSFTYRGVASLSLAPGAREVIPLPCLGAGNSLGFSIIYGTEVAQGYTFGTSAVAAVTVTAAPSGNSDYYLTWSGNYYYGYYGAGAWQERNDAAASSGVSFPSVVDQLAWFMKGFLFGTMLFLTVAAVRLFGKAAGSTSVDL